jgi:hypothetical protein
MEKEGFDVESRTLGKKLLADAQELYNDCLKKKDSLKAIRKKFKSKWAAHNMIFRKQRKKALLLFSDDSLTAEKLAISGIFPTNYVEWSEKVKKFYTVAGSDPEIQNKLATLKINAEDISAGLAVIEELDSIYAEQMSEKGDKQALTKAKNKAFGILQDWMSKFYKLARLALHDDPQLLEVLGKKIKS